MFTRAIVRKPCKNIAKGLTAANLGTPKYEKALTQHSNYVQALRDCGLEILELEAEEDYPDSVFIEDIALLTPHFALITNPGASSRRGETAGIKEVLQEFYEDIFEIEPPGTLEAGDVMMADTHYFIGLSGRTNREGAEQLIALLNKFNLSGSTVELQNLLHLKTGVSYLENNTMLVAQELKGTELFDNYRCIEVPTEETYAANCIWVNGTVIVPKGYPVTLQKIRDAGFDRIITVDTSEFRKLDGGLSCLSLRF
jgi:dimethylargininase